MRPIRFIVAALLLAGLVCAQAPQAPKRKRILAIGQTKGFQHDSTSDGLATIWKIGKDTGLWDTYIRTDTQLITKLKLKDNAKNLDYFDAVFFYTSGELDLNEEQKSALLEFVRTEGKGFMAAHSGVDTLYSWPEYGEMVGGYFDLHPWNQFNAKIVNEDPKHPATAHFPKDFFLFDEIYQLKNYSRDRVRVLMRLDTAAVDLAKNGVHRTDQDFAISWVRNYGKGRVFVSTLGHRSEVWENAQVQKMWLEAAKWVMGMTPGGETAPRPKP
ncbi:MAG: ThuA domain-containing protein [Acidobacteria bacterium]|nr:ThuA domain-containing protein [Acidobacteriota bacterium]